ncbi:hypothetical protein [Hippea jasoniae]|uniref:hypothetical protein n=1 Tax=Hippea jasoniae TaxID=944479 RepID=UPI000557D69B|nr:hypothetical protein [Hippea jasoniae]
MKILLSAMGKTGSTVMGNMLAKLFNTKGKPPIIVTIQNLLNDLFKLLEENGALNYKIIANIGQSLIGKKSCMNIHTLLINRSNNAFEKIVNGYISNDFLSFLSNCENNNKDNYMMRIYAPPDKIEKNPYLKNFEKNIFNKKHL